MKAFIKKHSFTLFLTLFILLVYFVFYITGIGCPIKFITGISCAGCGITRAFIHVLRLDLKGAFLYHPLWFTVPITLVLLVFFYAKKMKKAYTATLYVFSFLMLTVYAVRMFSSGGDIVVFEPQNGVIFQFLSNIFKTPKI